MNFSGLGIESFNVAEYTDFGYRLDLSDNRLATLSPTLEFCLCQLQELDLSNNRMTTVDPELIECSEQLKKLWMKRSFSPEAIVDMDFVKSLRSLELLSANWPDSADFQMLATLSCLQDLGLSGLPSVDANQKRKKLTKQEFHQLKGLGSLQLSHFELTQVKASTIDETFSELVYLRLVKNRIAKIHPGAFRGKKIRELYLSCNLLEEFGADLIDHLPEIEKLLLDHNLIGAISLNGVVSKLDELSLAHNPVRTIHPGSFANFTPLTRLDLQHCKLKSIDVATFGGLENLRQLQLDNNEIESILGMSSDLKRLRRLQLAGNKIKDLDLNHFRYLVELDHLYLANNLIERLDPPAGDDAVLANLRHLSLQHNQLRSIPKLALTNLTELDLSHNQLERLDEDFFQPLGKLASLHLSHNKLSLRISESTFSSAVLSTLHLEDNDCIEISSGTAGKWLGMRNFAFDSSLSPADF